MRKNPISPKTVPRAMWPTMPTIVNTFSSSSLIFRSFSFFLKLCVIPRQ